MLRCARYDRTATVRQRKVNAEDPPPRGLKSAAPPILSHAPLVSSMRIALQIPTRSPINSGFDVRVGSVRGEGWNAH